MAAQTQWTVDISPDLDSDLRAFLAEEGKTGPEAVSQFVREAVQDRLFEEAARRAKSANAGLTEDEILMAVDEAVDSIRSHK